MRKSVLLSVLAILLAAGILFAASWGLAGLARKNAEEDLLRKMQTILPGSSAFQPEEYTGEDANIAAVYKGETGYVVCTVTAGYAGDIAMIVGVSNDGTVTGMQIRDMAETWGLGRNALSDWEFLAQFLTTDGTAAVGTDIDALTGATVTSKAITRGVNSAVGFVTGADSSSGATAWGG